MKVGVFRVDDDEIARALSARFMSAEGLRGRTIFNPSGVKTYVREYNHAAPQTFSRVVVHRRFPYFFVYTFFMRIIYIFVKNSED